MPMTLVDGVDRQCIHTVHYVAIHLQAMTAYGVCCIQDCSTHSAETMRWGCVQRLWKCGLTLSLQVGRRL